MSRSNWKGPYLNIQQKKKHNTIILARNSKIVPNFIGSTSLIYNGMNYKEIIITEDMLDHKGGEFSFTRKKFSFKKKKSKK